MLKFDERMREIRKQKGLTQKEVGINTNLKERTIQNYELGTRRPTYETLIAIADFFDVSIDYLVGRSDRPERL